MDLWIEVRRRVLNGEMSKRAACREFDICWQTLQKMLEHPEPPGYRLTKPRPSKLEPFLPIIHEILKTDRQVHRKQRHTATRVLARLVDEHEAAGLSYSTVRDYVRVRRAQIDAAAGRRVEVFVPQEHAPGEEAEVDFGEVWVILGGVKTKCHMFTFRLSHSGKAVHRVYSTQSQEAFLEGHIDAFDEIGGIPTRHIRYDNLTAAVQTVLYGKGRSRVENDRWVLFRSHYGFDSFYCQPGIDGAHEKGGVEGEVGRFRRTWLSPMPVIDSLAELNEQIRRWDARDNERRINTRIRTVGQDFIDEQARLTPLPGERFDPGLVLYPRVDRSSLITVRMARYSVPARLIGRKVRVSLRASELVVFDGHAEVARHERVVARGGESINLDHYLEVLRRKPGALPGSTALARAREAGVFTTAHDAFWQQARKVDGDSAGTRALIDVLLLHRTMRTVDVIAGIRAALTVGAVSADVVAVEARLHAAGPESDRHRVEQPRRDVQRVVSLTQRRLMDPAAVIAGLPADRRPLPSVAHYDELLNRRSEPEPPVTDEREGIAGS